MAVFYSKSESETEAIGEAFARTLRGGEVVAMYGELGAGKTAFVRGMARGMGIDCRVSSPTFTIVNEYRGERELIHPQAVSRQSSFLWELICRECCYLGENML